MACYSTKQSLGKSELMTPFATNHRSQEKKLFCPRPAAQGRHVPSLANHGSSRGSPAAPGASAGSVVPRGPAAPLRINLCGRAIAPASGFAAAFGQPAYAVCLRQRAQPAAYAHARPVASQPFGRARPPRHALAAAPAPCALGRPRLRFPGRARRHASSPGSRRGHTRRPRPSGHRLTPLAPSLAPAPARATKPAADAPGRSPGAAETVTKR